MSIAVARLKESQFDFVHDNQKTFRTIMMALAFPGKLYQLQLISLSIPRKDLHYILLPFLTLLDFETSYFVYGSNTEEVSVIKEYIHINTNCLHTDCAYADFILCLDNSLEDNFSLLKRGTLYQPNKNATVFYNVNSIDYNRFSGSQRLSLAGPGVNGELDLYLSDITGKEIEQWINSRMDYPLGIDIYVVSKSGKIVGIPRSIRIKHKEG